MPSRKMTASRRSRQAASSALNRAPGTGLTCIVHDQRRVVGKAVLGINARLADILGRVAADHLIVQPPPHVLFPGPAAVGPPCVLVRARVDLAEGIVQSYRAEHLVHPGPLFGQEPGVLAVGPPVPEVDFLVRDVPVAADHVVASVTGHFFETRLEVVHHFVLDGLADVARRARRQIKRDHRQIAEIGLKPAALAIHPVPADAELNPVGRLAGINRGAGIALLDCIMVDGGVEVARFELRIGKLMLLSLGFLDAYHVGALALEPVEEALARGGANPVGIEGDDAHWRVCYVTSPPMVAVWFAENPVDFRSWKNGRANSSSWRARRVHSSSAASS